MLLFGLLPIDPVRVRRWLVACLCMAFLVLQGCATVERPDKRDPLESFNRTMFGFNETMDKYVAKPVATTYRDALPSWFRKGVNNFFSNLDDLWSGVNSIFQGKRQEAGDNIGRFMVNTVVGLCGVLDVASDLGIERHSTNFGYTLGKWGVPPGPYVVLPVLGPYTLREVGAIPVDQQGSLQNHIPDVTTRDTLTVVDLIDTRASLLGADDVMNGAALDRYTFMRDAYLQRQRSREYDGNPPDDENNDPSVSTESPSGVN
ncbi:VacJ family lipoprotein [Curvibacter sp. CHRR-16]|uniref:MlaA family lipoprotein n=1 Tax=Curvibacter sp. CHRR-16 TaxID=2835872 RepID=UPI001BD9BEA4|nr:VacJ family lipoprotein [Curvibacter sp. CHRR-16]MBT0569440.1 VacJ family lipoprotein [Curvibacter sp. CHRR-16]